MINLIDTYLNLYQISLSACCLFLWVMLSYVDRIHLRERARRFGLYISSIIAYLLVNTYIYDKFRVIVVRPLCTIFETLVGFLEGIENFEAVILLSDNNDRYLRDDEMDRNHEITTRTHHVTEIKEDNNTNMDQNKTEKTCDIDQPIVSDDEKSDDLCSRENDVFAESKIDIKPNNGLNHEESVLAKIDNNDNYRKLEADDIHSESESEDMTDSEENCKVLIKDRSKYNPESNTNKDNRDDTSKDNKDDTSKDNRDDTSKDNRDNASKDKRDDGVNKRKKVPIRLVRRKYQN